MLKAHWDARKAVKQNLASMGLAYDANQVMSLKSTKRQCVDRARGLVPDQANPEEPQQPQNEVPQEAGSDESGWNVVLVFLRTGSMYVFIIISGETPVVRALKEEAAQVPVRQTFRFTKEEVRWIAHMMDKHGDDFKVSRIADDDTLR